MRKLWLAASAAFGLAATATVAPPTPEQIIMMNKQNALELRARLAFGDHGLIEKLRDWRKNWGYILVGAEGSSAPPRLLIKDEYGWYEMRPGQTIRLPIALGQELNRLVKSEDVWAEDAYNFKAKCSGTPRLFVIMHGGRDKFGRLGCGPEGRAARIAQTAEALRIIPGPVQTTAPARPPRDDPPGASAAYFEASRQASGQIGDMAAAWERKTLAGFVEPYAPNVILEGPFGKYQGRKMVVDWARSLQDWNAPYAEGDRKMRLEKMVSKNQEAKDVFYTQHEFRWEELGQRQRQTFSTMWRNFDGQWLIVHEKISEVKPVTEERSTW